MVEEELEEELEELTCLECGCTFDEVSHEQCLIDWAEAIGADVKDCCIHELFDTDN
jgi:hypothetical protein